VARGSAQWVLCLLAVGTLVAGVAVGRTSTGTSPDPQAAPTPAAPLAAWCGSRPDPGRCLDDALASELRAQGQAAAFATLGQLVAVPALAGQDHILAHHLGRVAYAVAGNATRALAACPTTMGNGCTHGVLEAYLADRGLGAPVVGLCDATGRGAAHQQGQCWHGVGHGLEMATGYNWTAALARCLELGDYGMRADCASGVFMENVVGDPATMEGEDGSSVGTMGGMGGMGMSMPASTAGPDRMRADDLLYPCRLVTDAAAGEGCWEDEAELVLRLTGSFGRAAEACTQAHGPRGAFARACEEGIGQQAAAHARAFGSDAFATCGNAALNATAQQHCVLGAVEDTVNNADGVAAGIAFCAKAPAADAQTCYSAVGLMHRSMQSDAYARVAACASAPAMYQASCAGA